MQQRTQKKDKMQTYMFSFSYVPWNFLAYQSQPVMAFSKFLVPKQEKKGHCVITRYTNSVDNNKI